LSTIIIKSDSPFSVLNSLLFLIPPQINLLRWAFALRPIARSAVVSLETAPLGIRPAAHSPQRGGFFGISISFSAGRMPSGAGHCQGSVEI
jgi:hypothetical protein